MLLARWYKVSHKIGPGWEGLLSEFEARYFVARTHADKISIYSQYSEIQGELLRACLARFFPNLRPPRS